ncbi:type II secretion system protein GspC [Serratia sp. UGAL515B_01]|uniref:type II secretion system protein GspC n=1 Tax=Serratia sp. UGAL515B_01 TaxID=2986763 RepID=UPI002955C3AC|nr:type II secretion system protein GspC [Serratia sp. UGAL515B_01]WON76416.1 type II secretion system protein GspC [Serratia sp. UGAL515B_01]
MMQFSGMTLSIKGSVLKWLTPRWVLYVALFLMLNQLAMLTWHLWLPSEIPAPVLSKENLPQVSKARSDTAVVTHFTLFGTASPASTKAVDIAGSDSSLLKAPPSVLKINLTGIVASPTPAHSIAIIAKGSKQFSLTIGDNTPGYDAKIAAIYPDRVVISYQGRYEALHLFGESSVVAKAGGERPLSIQAELKQQPQNILNYLNISPVMVGNKLTGYRLNPGVQKELFQKVGLRENDLAVAINGLDLRDAQQSQQALKQLPELSELNLTVERDGQLQDIYIALGDN